MAFQTGSQVNAALGRTDFTPFLQGALQGAQSQARGGELLGKGLAGLGEQAGTAIKEYYLKKETKELEDGAVSMINERIKKNPVLADVLGIKKDKDGNYDQKAMRVGAKTFGLKAIYDIGKSLDDEEKLKGLFNQTNPPSAASEASLMGGTSVNPADFTPDTTTPLSVQQFIERGFAANIDPNKIAGVANAMVNAREAELRAQPRPRDPAEILKLNAEVDKLRAEARRADAQAAAAGQPTPANTLAQNKFDYQQKKDEVKTAQTDANLLDQAAAHKAMLGTTLSNIDESIALLEKGAGGPIQGYAPVAAVGSIFGGGSSKILLSKLDSIKSAVKLDNIMSMKAMSKTGSTGLGQISNQEGSDLANNIAKIDPTLPEKEQIKNLNRIRNTLVKLGNIKDKEIAPKVEKLPPTLQIKSIKKIGN
jgi:hypothetical protein